MPVFSHQYLHNVASQIYVAEGVPMEEAEIVATHQVKANLVGHDSHGVIHILEYVERTHRGDDVLLQLELLGRVDRFAGFGARRQLFAPVPVVLRAPQVEGTAAHHDGEP